MSGDPPDSFFLGSKFPEVMNGTRDEYAPFGGTCNEPQSKDEARRIAVNVATGSVFNLLVLPYPVRSHQ
jgi:hypothetical protein